MTALEFQLKHRRHVLDYRRQENIVQSETFAEAWKMASPVQLERIQYLLKHPDPIYLRELILTILFDFLPSLSLRKLRQLASFAGIAYYSKQSKSQLSEELQRKGINDSKNRSRVS